MKKTILMATVALFALQANAQEALEESNICDNWYVGVNAGIGMKTTENSDVLKNLNPSVGLRLGRYWTPVTGWMISGEVFLRDKAFDWSDAKTVKGTSVDLLGTLNLSNWFGGYLGEPRHFEVVALAGLGWNHVFDTKLARANDMVSKFGLDFTFNLGEKKAWQFYIEPAIKAQVVAKNKQVAERDKTIATLQDDLEAAKKVKPTVTTVTKVVNNNVLQPTVIFGQGKSTVDAAQMASVAMVAKYMKNHPESKILIKGYASPEGNPELNQKLSEARANAVKKVLVGRYGIAEGRLTVQGMGATSELFDEIDFNRVATFTDTTK